jgi:hypothetical protein
LDKIGYALRIDDLPETFALKKDVVKWEEQFWKNKVSDEFFAARLIPRLRCMRHMREVAENAKHFAPIFHSWPNICHGMKTRPIREKKTCITAPMLQHKIRIGPTL